MYVFVCTPNGARGVARGMPTPACNPKSPAISPRLSVSLGTVITLVDIDSGSADAESDDRPWRVLRLDRLRPRGYGR